MDKTRNEANNEPPTMEEAMARRMKKAMKTLGSDFRSSTPQAYCGVGSIWHGDWRNAKEGGSSFGTFSKPNHFACVTRHRADSPVMNLAPITSQPHSLKKCLVLRPGILPAGSFKTGYLLFSIVLRATRPRLVKEFEYKGNLPPPIVDELKQRMGHES
jgi:hypothetical protein